MAKMAKMRDASARARASGTTRDEDVKRMAKKSVEETLEGAGGLSRLAQSTCLCKTRYVRNGGLV